MLLRAAARSCPRSYHARAARDTSGWRAGPHHSQRDGKLAAHRLVVEPQPVLDRALDEPRDGPVGRLEQQAIGAPAAAREHAEPCQEAVARLALDDEQRTDLAGADAERHVLR